ncbi:hypothetical protein XMIN_1997 [Xanthomonas citri pv. mangiferaeindicae LMG 941]|nr:hypothetical protein XMIN_1997 [Xanthomonas citri pv. mangiferaeindicae LMG 941]
MDEVVCVDAHQVRQRPSAFWPTASPAGAGHRTQPPSCHLSLPSNACKHASNQFYGNSPIGRQTQTG